MIRLLALLVLVVLPIADLWLLVRISAVVGPWITALIVLGGLALGVGLVRDHGGRLLRAPPAHVVIEGGLVLAGGVLLASPGVLSDVLGLLLLLPPGRELLAPRVAGWLGVRTATLGDPPRAQGPADHPFSSPFDDLP